MDDYVVPEVPEIFRANSQGCRVLTKSMVLRTSSMVDVKENSNGVALLEEKVMAALTQLIVFSLPQKVFRV